MFALERSRPKNMRKMQKAFSKIENDSEYEIEREKREVHDSKHK